VPQRRLGQLRQRQHQDDLPVHPLRRSQRHARSAHGRHHGKNSGDAGHYGYTRDDKRVEKAIKFIFKEQEPDGSWFGRWGVNYIYGTFLVLRGLEAIGIDHLEPQVQQAAEWIRMVQNPDGGWGETCGSYDDPNTRGVGPSTPSQTAWALLGLLSAGDDRSDSIAKGVRWLLDVRQSADGSWDESMGEGPTRQNIITGTGFPRVFYLAYDMYRITSRFWRFDHLQAGHGALAS
jgi:squalene-hopene/tetraprenyl-beta-curcumene cyclase